MFSDAEVVSCADHLHLGTHYHFHISDRAPIATLARKHFEHHRNASLCQITQDSRLCLLVLDLCQSEFVRELSGGHTQLEQLLEHGRKVVEELGLVLGVCVQCLQSATERLSRSQLSDSHVST